MKVNDKVTFKEEPDLPYTVQAAGERFVILTRKIQKEDYEAREPRSVAPTGIPEVIPDGVIYTIFDREEGVRGPDNMQFDSLQYKTQEGCQQALAALDAGRFKISEKHKIRAVWAKGE